MLQPCPAVLSLQTLRDERTECKQRSTGALCVIVTRGQRQRLLSFGTALSQQALDRNKRHAITQSRRYRNARDDACSPQSGRACIKKFLPRRGAATLCRLSRRRQGRARAEREWSASGMRSNMQCASLARIATRKQRQVFCGHTAAPLLAGAGEGECWVRPGSCVLA